MRFSVFVVSVALLMANSIARAAESAPEAVFPKGVKEVITGMAAVVAGSEQLQQTVRSTDRLHLVRAGLLNVVRRPELFERPNPPKLLLSNEDILCGPRGRYATIAGYRGYSTSVITGIKSMATPSAIASIGDALGSIFQDYVVQIDADATSVVRLESQARKNCRDELKKYADAYYGKFTATDPPTENFGPATFVAFAGLVSAVSAIVTPIATTIASEVDKKRRQDAIIAYFKEGSAAEARRRQIRKAISYLAPAITQFADQRRMQALGEFSERMAKIRSLELRLSEPCKVALHVVVGNDRRTEDAFSLCYAAVWKPYSDDVNAAIKAAELYDALADAMPAPGTPNALTALDAQLAEIGKSNPATIQNIWKTLVQLYAMANTINSALSTENRKKASDAIDNLMNGF